MAPAAKRILPEQVDQFSQQFSQHKIESLEAERDKVTTERDEVKEQLKEANRKLTQFVDSAESPFNAAKKRRAFRLGR